MLPLWLLRRGGRCAEHAYRFATEALISDRPVPGLEALALKKGAIDLPPIPPSLPPELWSSEPPPTFEGNVLLADASRHLRCTRFTDADHDLDLLRFEGGTVAVARDGTRVEWQLSEDLPPSLQAAWIHGPALALALAHRHVFCLHTSAVALPRGAALFLGPSGAGKSTLAALLADFPRLADDVVALPADDPPTVTPELAHLGLDPEARRAVAAQPSRLPLAAIFFLGEPSPHVRSEPLGPAAAVAHLLGQTVAANLFDPPLAGRLLDRWTSLVHQVPVRFLHYPRTRDVGPAVREHLASFIDE